MSNCWQRSQHTKQQADPREANAETFASNIEINGTYRNNGIITGVSNPPDNGIISYLTLNIKAFIAVSVPKKVISVSNQGFHQLVIIQASIAMSIFLVTHCETIADPHSLTFKASFIASYNVTCFGGVGGFSWISFIKNHNILLCQISFTRYSPCDPIFFIFCTIYWDSNDLFLIKLPQLYSLHITQIILEFKSNFLIISDFSTKYFWGIFLHRFFHYSWIFSG